MPTLPVSVLIPTRNSAAFVPAHLESLREWIDLAEEIVVVDSDSRDGTVEMLRAGLSHPRIKFLTHPPGLYQSWNFAVQNAGAKYIYIATVGDPILRRGLEHLFAVAEQFQSDVVISKPNFIDTTGNPMPDHRWPVDVILNRLQIKTPRLLTTAEQFVFAVTNTWGAILGSSASDLYRTDCLKRRPFPTEFGTAGDGGWGIQNIFDVKIAVTPERFSSFRHHDKTYSLAEYYVESLDYKFLRLAQAVVAKEQARNPLVAGVLEQVQWPELEKALEIVPVYQEKLEGYRKQKIPWVLRPSAWMTRRARNQARKKIDDITAYALAAQPGSPR